MTIVESKTNSKNIKYAIIAEGDTFGVWKLCKNYNRHVKGGISRSWRYVERNMTLEAAQSLFKRRSK